MARAAPTFLPSARRARPSEVRRLLVANHLLLGDTIMLTPLLKKARQCYREAEILMMVPNAYAPLYGGEPYGVRAAGLDERSVASNAALLRESGFDLALVPGDNRWSWLARALRARWIVAFASDERSYKDVPVDEFVQMPQEPRPWGDIAAGLLAGGAPEPYEPGEWPAPSFRPYPAPGKPYCVLHLGASSPHKLWPPERWRSVVEWAERKGYAVVLSAGRGEETLLSPVDREGTRSGLAGNLDLPQLWDLLRNASFLVCPDTGVAHMGRVVGVPTVAIYGPGSPVNSGPGDFWKKSPFRAVWDPDVACRDQDRLFERRLPWVRHCWRQVSECGNPVCVRRVVVDQVIDSIRSLIGPG